VRVRRAMRRAVFRGVIVWVMLSRTPSRYCSYSGRRLRLRGLVEVAEGAVRVEARDDVAEEAMEAMEDMLDILERRRERSAGLVWGV